MQQNHLPPGTTIIPIILTSDKTPVTRQTGGLEMHLVFMLIGNIQSDVRMQAMSHAWRCIAFIPTPEFEVHPDYQTVTRSVAKVVLGSSKTRRAILTKRPTSFWA